MSQINLKQCDRCGAMLDANSAFCGNCGKQFGSSGEYSPTPPPGELQQRPITPGFSNPGLYTPSQPDYIPPPPPQDYVSPPPPRHRSNRIYLVVIALLVLMLLGTFVFFLGKESSQGSTGNTPNTPNQGVTNPANNTATSTVATASPTDSTTTPTDLTATSTGLTLAPSETIPEKITLKCDCSDPVVVTITQIVIQPQQNRMLWSMAFFNNSQKGDCCTQFSEFYLQKGDQIHNPAPGEQTYTPTGPSVDSDFILGAGETQKVTITFSFVPYQGIPYTLISQLSGATFNPVVIQF